MFEYDNTLIIFGRSPYINKIKKYIPTLCKKYHTIGCNYFVNTFPEVENVIFYDDIVPEVKARHRVITNIKYSAVTSYKSYNLIRTHQNCELYNIQRAFAFSFSPDRLHMCIHTPSLAMNWALFKKYQNIILAGIDLTLENKKHFDAKTTPDNNENDFNKNAILHAREHLEYAKSFFHIYQLNPDNDLDIKKIKIKEIV